jgi:integrase
MLLHEEWWELRKATLAEGKVHHRMSAAERIVLFAVAIQTGLRVNELRSLSYGNLFLDGPEPFITCKARGRRNGKSRGPKNGRDCKQYIKPDLAADLRANLNGYGKVFPNLPDRQHTAPMLREDVAAARAAWVKEATDGAERSRREASDFLLPVNFAEEVLDFHALRHTCGAWLALANCHPKVVQTVMRHSTITLTMDAYGHLFPGQVPEAVSKLPDMMNI